MAWTHRPHPWSTAAAYARAAAPVLIQPRTEDAFEISDGFVRRPIISDVAPDVAPDVASDVTTATRNDLGSARSRHGSASARETSGTAAPPSAAACSRAAFLAILRRASGEGPESDDDDPPSLSSSSSSSSSSVSFSSLAAPNSSKPPPPKPEPKPSFIGEKLVGRDDDDAAVASRLDTGESLRSGEERQVDVTFPGGFIDAENGAWNSEAPSVDDTVLGREVVVFSRWSDNLGGDVAANALYASHGGLYTTIDTREGKIVQGRGEGYAIPMNVTVSRLRDDITSFAQAQKK